MRFISENPIGWALGQVNNYAWVAIRFLELTVRPISPHWF